MGTISTTISNPFITNSLSVEKADRLHSPTTPSDSSGTGTIETISHTDSPIVFQKNTQSLSKREGFRIDGEDLHTRVRRSINKRLYIYSSEKSARSLVPSYQCELWDRQHRYGASLNPFYKVWEKAKTIDDFDTWMNKLDNRQKLDNGELVPVPGTDELQSQKLLSKEGKPISLDKEGKPISIPKVLYLNEEERKDYEMQVDDQGRVSTKKHGKPFHSIEGATKDNSFIFVIGLDDTVYIGPYSKGTFAHSTPLSGGPVKAAGILVFKDGIIKEIIDNSGHYNSDPSAGSSKEMMDYTLKVLHSKGIDTKEIKVTFTDKKDMTKIPA